MTEFFDTTPDCAVAESEYQRLLGYPANRVLEGRPRELAGWARGWFAGNGRPWIYAVLAEELEIASDRTVINGSKFSKLPRRSAPTHGAWLVAVSAGATCEEAARELWNEGKPDEYFFLEIFGSAVVEHLMAQASGRICAWADSNGSAALPHYSPGYSGWDISEQVSLHEVICRKAPAEVSGQLQVMDSGMLCPKKSQLAVFGITKNLELSRSAKNLIPCANCSLARCQYRRHDYRHAPPRIENLASHAAISSS